MRQWLASLFVRDQSATPFNPDVALRRLLYLALVGGVFIVVYAFRSGQANTITIASVGLMAAGAALLSGGLLGFLFGVPHTRDLEPTAQSSQAAVNGAISASAPIRLNDGEQRSNVSGEYEPGAGRRLVDKDYCRRRPRPIPLHPSTRF